MYLNQRSDINQLITYRYVQIHTNTCDKYKYIQIHPIQAIYIQINTNTYRYISGTHSPGPALKFNWRLLIQINQD
jgi:hypothetical protein